MPTSAWESPSSQRRAVSEGLIEATGRNSKRCFNRDKISRPRTTISFCQARAESKGMNSMKRMLNCRSIANWASASIS